MPSKDLKTYIVHTLDGEIFKIKANEFSMCQTLRFYKNKELIAWFTKVKLFYKECKECKEVIYTK